MKTAVEIFSQLGERLAAFGKDARSSAVIERAVAENGWFTADGIRTAVEALRSEMLDADKLQKWLSGYDLTGIKPRRVAIVMAGNIPLVGFFDLLCTIVCGHCAVIKPSGKDRVLVEYIVELLREIEPAIAIEECDNESLTPADADAVIATGNNNTRRHFKAVFAGKPQLLRGSRHSVAVLSGNESAAQLEGLGRDIVTYSGLGCRNVSMLFVPAGYRLQINAIPSNPKFRNNYIQTRAVMLMRGEEFSDTGGMLLVGSDELPAAISCIAVKEYKELSEAAEWLAAHDEVVQCVVSECLEHPRRVSFGCAQHPQLTDYPDDIDVVKFLLNLI